MSGWLGHAAVDAALDWAPLIEELAAWYRAGQVVAPERQVLSMPQPGGGEASLLLMPAWVPGEKIGVKVVTFLPENAAKGRPTINAGYLLFDGETGRLSAALDGDAITARRTAAASALAARHLARAEASELLVVGTGQLAAAVVRAQATVRSYGRISIWGRSPEKAAAIAAELAAEGYPAAVAEDLERAVRSADVISTVTASTRPIIQGDWLKPGSHLDLIGAFKPDMRECDDLAVTQAEVFVDLRSSASLAGDLAQPLAAGIIAPEHIRADLTELCRSTHPGRSGPEARTLFKSAGMALQDLAAADLARRHNVSG